MSIEFDQPEDVTQMRQIARDWIENRPTLQYTQENLFQVFTNEGFELNTAISIAEPPQNILLEVGDVLFSALTVDDGSDIYTDLYAKVSAYCLGHGTNIIDLFKQTHYKNRVNYPITFFNKMSPFKNSADAVSCLRILRTATNRDVKELDDLWYQSDSMVNNEQPCFFDRGHANEIFRRSIKISLRKAKKLIQNYFIKDEVNRLYKVGEWGYQDLDIQNNKFNWYRLL